MSKNKDTKPTKETKVIVPKPAVNYAVGDTVLVNAGTPFLATVDELREDEIVCSWYNADSEQHTGLFPYSLVTPSTPAVSEVQTLSAHEQYLTKKSVAKLVMARDGITYGEAIALVPDSAIVNLDANLIFENL